MTVIPLTDRAHMDRVCERLGQMEMLVAQGNRDLAKALGSDEVLRFGELASKARSGAKRVFWLRQMSAVAERAASPVAACRAGCSHCCHIDVAVSRAEAVQIARETGRPLDQPRSMRTPLDLVNAGDEAQETPRHAGTPCPFLVDSACSIYPWRPLACRLHFNLDHDALLCQLVEGQAIPAPYFNATLLKAIAMQVFGLHSPYADIRDWFGSR